MDYQSAEQMAVPLANLMEQPSEKRLDAQLAAPTAPWMAHQTDARLVVLMVPNSVDNLAGLMAAQKVRR